MARILSDAPWTKNDRIQLCLQPMTHPEILRAFLCDNGYLITDEAVVDEDGRLYQIILASWTGKREEYTDAELFFGRINISQRTEVFLGLARKSRDIFTKRAEGKESAGEEAVYERDMIEQINAILSEEKI